MGCLHHHEACMQVLGALVQRCAGPDGVVSVTMAELDAVAYSLLLEGYDENGNFIMKIEKKPQND